MTRFNLWVTHDDGHSIICYGDQGTMDSLANHLRHCNLLLAGIEGDVHVLPDGREPGDPQPQPET